jgi:hypothetical protein
MASGRTMTSASEVTSSVKTIVNVTVPIHTSSSTWLSDHQV